MDEPRHSLTITFSWHDLYWVSLAVISVVLLAVDMWGVAPTRSWGVLAGVWGSAIFIVRHTPSRESAQEEIFDALVDEVRNVSPLRRDS